MTHSLASCHTEIFRPRKQVLEEDWNLLFDDWVKVVDLRLVEETVESASIVSPLLTIAHKREAPVMSRAVQRLERS
jgi:hypothetical protein